MNYELVMMNEDLAIEYAKSNPLSWSQSYKGIID